MWNDLHKYLDVLDYHIQHLMLQCLHLECHSLAKTFMRDFTFRKIRTNILTIQMIRHPQFLKDSAVEYPSILALPSSSMRFRMSLPLIRLISLLCIWGSLRSSLREVGSNFLSEAAVELVSYLVSSILYCLSCANLFDSSISYFRFSTISVINYVFCSLISSAPGGFYQ